MNKNTAKQPSHIMTRINGLMVDAVSITGWFGDFKCECTHEIDRDREKIKKETRIPSSIKYKI